MDRPALPQFQYDYSAEREIRWINAKPLHAGLSVREAIIAGKLPDHLELLARAVGPLPHRAWFHDRSGKPDGIQYGVHPVLYAGKPSTMFTPSPQVGVAKHLHDSYLSRIDKQRAGLVEIIERTGTAWRQNGRHL